MTEYIVLCFTTDVVEVDRAKQEEDQRKLAKMEEQLNKKRELDKAGSKRLAYFSFL